jgi:hypothetical protein
MKRLFLFILFALTLSNFVIAADTTPVQPVDCRDQTNPLIANLTICEQDRGNLNESLEYYKNLSNYYKELYESKEVNVTNRELISLHQNIFILNQNITDLHTEIGELRQEISFFHITFELSLALISLTILGSIIKFANKKWSIKQRITTVIFGSQ